MLSSLFIYEPFSSPPSPCSHPTLSINKQPIMNLCMHVCMDECVYVYVYLLFACFVILLSRFDFSEVIYSIKLKFDFRL